MYRKFIIYILTGLLGLSLKGNIAAQNILDMEVGANFTDSTLIGFFQAMEDKYHVRFFYKADWIGEIKIPKMNENETLRSILEYTLDYHNLSHIDIQQNNIILVPDDYKYYINDQQVNFIRIIGNPIEKGKFKRNKVEGIVYNGKTGEPLMGVTVMDAKNNKQTITNNSGYYSLYLPGGVTKLEFLFIGLETKAVDVEVLSNGKLDVEMMESPITLSSVTITADGGRNNVERTQMGVVHLDIRRIAKLPALMGEMDVIKSITLLPGVSTSGEMSSGFNVRGSNIDQNLVLVNNAPVYCMSHLFGMFSTLIPASISSVSLHKGTQPANFGSRASSVTEIQLKDCDTAKINGKAGIGILNSSFFLEGPVIKNHCSFLFGARTTYSNWMLKKIPDIDIQRSEASFYDLIGKIDIKLNDKSNISVFGYGSNDYFEYSDKMDYAYGSMVGGVNYDLFINDVVDFHSALSYSGFNSSVGYIEDLSIAYKVSSGIEQLNGRMEWNIHLAQHNMLTGFEVIGYNISPGEQEKYNENSDAIAFSFDDEKALEGAVFFQDNLKLSDRISLFGGVRYSWYSKIGEATSYTYQQDQPKNDNTVTDALYFSEGELLKSYHGPEPRIGLRIGINESSSIKTGYNITRQYQQLISNTSASMPSDYWKSADINIKPIINQQYSVGYYKNFNRNIIETSVECYYKTSDHVLEYKNGAVLIMNPAIERDVIAGFSKSYGMELMLRKNQGKLTGWLSYTLSKSLIKTDNRYYEEIINNGEFYPTYNDRFHDFSASMNYQLTRRWTLSSIFLFSSGRPTTFPEKRYQYHQVELVYYSERNKYRLPAYHRLDLSVTYEGFLNKTRKLHPSFTFSIFNVYGHKNLYSVYYKKTYPSSAYHFQRYGLYKLTIIGVPIPSFTMNLSF